MNKEERFEIELNQEDVQNLINCYEKDIEYIKQLEQENKELHNKINKAIEYIVQEIYYCLSSGDNINIYLDKLLEILKDNE